SSSLHFFFQAEDGIRDLIVTGVQTCALPISSPLAAMLSPPSPVLVPSPAGCDSAAIDLRSGSGMTIKGASPGCQVSMVPASPPRSEERRVGKGHRAGWESVRRPGGGLRWGAQ